ncbi:MAG TPA: DinB family protein [Patescibacteria group bacterium]
MVPSKQDFLEYITAYKDLIKVVKNLSPKQLDFKISLTEWSIHEVIVHIADTEMIFCERIRRIIAEENPTLTPFNQEQWANNMFYNKQDYKLALNWFKLQRESTFALLQLLTKKEWERKAMKDGKEVTLFDIFNIAKKHIQTHLAQIEGIKNTKEYNKI